MTTSSLTGSGAAQGGANMVGSGVGDGPGPDVMAASTLDSTTVITSDGEDVGKIKDIMLDVRSGRVAYAVLTSGGFLGIGGYPPGDTLECIDARHGPKGVPSRHHCRPYQKRARLRQRPLAVDG